MALEIKVTKEKNHSYVVKLNGSIDNESYHKLDEELKELIDERTKAVILNMGEVTYISSAGIAVIVTAKKALKQINVSFDMVDLQPQIEKVFEVMKILPMIDIFHDMAEADQYIDKIIKEETQKI